MAKRPAKKAKSKPKAKPARPAAKTAAKKTVKKAAKKAPKKAVRTSAKVTVSPRIALELNMDMQDRLKALATVMNLSLEALMHQALSEFAETWEDHHRTVKALDADDDRMQVVVKD